MLAAETDYLQAAIALDIAVMIFGGVCGVGFLVWLSRQRRWRNPLAGLEPRAEGPSIIHLCGVFLLYISVFLVLTRLLVGGEKIAEAPVGSRIWFVVQIAEGTGKLAGAVLIVWILQRWPAFVGPRDSRLGLLTVAAVGLLGGLIITPMCAVQLQSVTIVTQWIQPDFIPPEHPVLAAVRDGELDWRGKLILLVGAVGIAPIAEELFFRGLLLQTVWRYTRHAWIAVTLSGVAFGAIHFAQPQAVLPLCTMGIALGYIRLRSRSLTTCIIVHAIFNGRTMVLALFFPEMIGEG
ncbi:MAG: type II CAAX endopeptidase family protein [Planctomycetota bacterium]